MLRRSLLAVIAAATFAATAGAQAISSPDAAYLASTTRLAMPAAGTFTSLSNGLFTVNFSTALESRQVGADWATWSTTPNSEWNGSDPYFVGFASGSTSITMTFSSAMTVFGFEAEPAPFSVLGMTAMFYNGASLVGTVARDVDGDAGARLFAFANAGGIDRVVFSSDANFAVASLRYASTVPEPTSLALLGLGLGGLAGAARRRRA